MNKTKVRLGGSVIIVMSLCLPRLVLTMNDYYENQKEVPIEHHQIEDILEKHPIISQIYAYEYENDDIEIVDYELKDKKNISLKIIKDVKDIYNKEIEKVISYDILPKDILKYKENLVYFDAIREEKVNQVKRYTLYQNDQFDSSKKEIEYTIDSQTHKIISVSVNQIGKYDFTQEDIKNTLWKMIKYLELDDIDDWVYHQNEYESYQSKLCVSFNGMIKNQYQIFTIEVSSLYHHSNNHISISEKEGK